MFLVMPMISSERDRMTLWTDIENAIEYMYSKFEAYGEEQALRYHPSERAPRLSFIDWYKEKACAYNLYFIEANAENKVNTYTVEDVIPFVVKLGYDMVYTKKGKK